MTGLASLFLLGCSSQSVVETKYLTLKPPPLVSCKRWTIEEFGAVDNGGLWAYKIQLEQSLDECANQVDAQIDWQAKTFSPSQQ